MSGLLWKEFVALRAFLGLVVGLFLVFFALTLATEFPDEQEMDLLWQHPEEMAAILGVMALIVSIGLLVRERDEGTLTYLDGLPVTRARVFWAKWAVALAILWFDLLLMLGEFLGYAYLSKTSVSEPIDWRTIGVWTGLYGFLCVWFLSVGMLLSFLRRWAFLVIGIVVWVMFILAQYRVPYLEYANPLVLGEAVFVGGKWVVPWVHLSVLGVIGVGALGLGLMLFSMRDNWLTKLGVWMNDTVWGKLLKWVALGMVVCVWLGFLIHFSIANRDVFYTEADQLTGELEARGADSGGVFEEATERYEFSYRPGDVVQVGVLTAGGDEVYVRMAELLGAEPFDGKVVVDLAQPIAEHNAGQAYWKKIRMSLHWGDSEEESLGVLGHETVHVFLEKLSGGRISDVFQSTRWFHEGVATYLQYRYILPEEKTREMDRWLAVASAWGQVEFEEVVDGRVLNERRDTNLVYPVGRLWVEALAGVHGVESIGVLTRAMAREDAPRKLQGLTLWRDLFQACGYRFEAVLAEFRRKLRELEEREGALIDSLPEPEGEVERVGGRIVIVPVYEGEAGGEAKLYCRVKPAQEAEFYEIDDVALGGDGTFKVMGLNYTKPTVWYQMGWRVEGMYSPVYGEWTEAEVGR